MSAIWYPVINYDKCIECSACISKCTHGVYNKEKAPTPVVIYPERCIDGCHGCGNLCNQKAISYVGEEDIANNCNSGSCGVSCDGNCYSSDSCNIKAV